MNSRGFWYILMAGSLGGWLFTIYGWLFPIEQGVLKTIWVAVALVWMVVHPLEIFITLPIGKKAGVGPVATALKTLLFGFTWWLPLKKGILES